MFEEADLDLVQLAVPLTGRFSAEPLIEQLRLAGQRDTSLTCRRTTGTLPRGANENPPLLSAVSHIIIHLHAEHSPND